MTVEGRLRRVTSADVAREAGVSRTTVSYVLNDTPHQKIPPATRQRILEAVQRLGYAPSPAARALQSGRSDVVLCLLPDWPIGPTVGSLLQHLSAALAAEGLTLLAHPRGAGTDVGSQVWKAITPAAVIAYEDFQDEEVDAIRAAGIQVTVALLNRSGRRREELGIPQQRIGRLQVEHLAAAGHRRLGYAFPDDSRVLSFAEPRLDGVRHACADLGLDAPIVRTVPLEVAGAVDAIQAWRAEAPAVTAVCAYNDEVALALLAGLRPLGLGAPDDLAVVGVDDIPAAALADPPLTTVVEDQRVVAENLALTIVRGLTGRPSPRRPSSKSLQVVRRESA
jgi:DNA-binding LacI/PurR family transcriptional regulator